MRPSEFKEANISMLAGDNPNTNDLKCGLALQAVPGVDHPVPFIVTKFELSDQDLEKIKETGEIYISLMTNMKQPTMPPILPSVENPYEELGFVPYDNKEGG